MTTVEEAIKVLNEINAADPTVLPTLINFRVPCNTLLAEHPTVQAGLRDAPLGQLMQPYEVGMLGIINGLFGVDENQWGHIYCAAAEHYPDGRIYRIAMFGTVDQFGPKEEEAP